MEPPVRPVEDARLALKARQPQLPAAQGEQSVKQLALVPRQRHELACVPSAANEQPVRAARAPDSDVPAVDQVSEQGSDRGARLFTTTADGTRQGGRHARPAQECGRRCRVLAGLPGSA